MKTEQQIKRAAKPFLAAFASGPLDGTLIRVSNADKVRVLPCDKVHKGKKLLVAYKLSSALTVGVFMYRFKGYVLPEQAQKAKAFITRVN